MAPGRALTKSFLPIVNHARRRQDVCRRWSSSLPQLNKGKAPGKGPLEGIRVLDMTRVLAGVRSQFCSWFYFER
jgi:hypothetical protein